MVRTTNPDRQSLARLLTALNASPRALRRDECACWRIGGSRGHVSADGSRWLLYVECRSARHWNSTKADLHWLTVRNDGDTEGILTTDRLPTPTEARAIRNRLGIPKRREAVAGQLAPFQFQPHKNGLSGPHIRETTEGLGL